MLSLEIDESIVSRVEKFLKDAPAAAEVANRKALKRAIQELKKIDLDSIYKKYTSSNVKLRISTKTNEATLKALSKRNSIDNFTVSLKKPGPSKTRLKTTIIKGNKKEWTTLFWAFYKGNGVPRLMKRQGADRHKISRATSVSDKNMGIGVLEVEFVRDYINKIYNEELMKGIERYGY